MMHQDFYAIRATGSAETLAASIGVRFNEKVISDQTLAHLNYGVFRQLRKLGTSQARIRAVLNLTPEEFDYVCNMG